MRIISRSHKAGFPKHWLLLLLQFTFTHVLLGADLPKIFDNLETLASWHASGGTTALQLSPQHVEGSYSLRFDKSNTATDYARVTKELESPQNLSNYERVTLQLFISDPAAVKKASLWFGRRDRWVDGCYRELPPLVAGWNDLSLRLFEFALQESDPRVWDDIQTFSLEINTGDPQVRFEGFLLDDIRLWKSPPDESRKHPFTPKEVPLAQLAGRPFFPIGLYSVSMQNTDSEWQEIADNGFNFITCAEAHYFNELVSQQQDVSHWLKFLDRAERFGLKVGVQLSSGEWTPTHGGGRLWWALDLNEDEVVREHLMRVGRNPQDAAYAANRQRHIHYLKTLIPAIKDHPALGTYESLDEIAQYLFPVEGMIEGRKFLKSLDPQTPYWQNHPSATVDPRWLRHYGQFADIVSLDIYPIPREFGYGGLPNKQINNVGEYTDLIRSAALTNQPAWMVLQAYTFNENEFAHLPQKGLRRFPSRDELRFMTFQSIVHGSRGILYFLYLTRPVEPLAHTYVNKPFTPEFWSALKEMGRNLDLMMPALLAETNYHAVQKPTPQAAVQWMVKQAAGHYWLVAVNETPKPATAQFTFHKEITAVDVMFEERDIATADNTFTDQFRPFGYRVYRVH